MKNMVLIVKGGIAALLILCLIDADYGYYQALRTLISFGFAYLAYRYYSDGDKKNAIVFLCLLIVFQPLLKIAFGRGLWIFIDIATAGFLIYQILVMDLGKTKDKSIKRYTSYNKVPKRNNNVESEKDFVDDHIDKYSKY